MINRLRRWWQERTGEAETPFDGDTPAWVISFGVHLTILVLLFALWIYVPSAEPAITMTPDEEPPEEEVFVSDPFHAPEPSTQIGNNAPIQGVESPQAAAAIQSDVSVVPTELPEAENAQFDLDPSLDLPTSPVVSDGPPVKGNPNGDGVTGAMGAIDRITHEILLKMAEGKPVLVVWLFDQSGSLDRTRKEIYKRFDRIYEELGQLEDGGHSAFKSKKDAPLTTAVMAFGKEVTHRTKEPTADLAEVKQAIEGIENDASGLEHVFSAVAQGVQKYRDWRFKNPRHNVMFVVVSDEVGDDEQYVDMTVALCQRNEVPIYVIGVPAAFGRDKLYVKYVDPDENFDQSVQWIPVRQGPESYRPEVVDLGFVGGKHKDLDEMDSGFGPFALTRLCYETGGIYFAVHPNRTAAARAMGNRETELMTARLQHFFDPGIMRRYRPDYVSLQEYDALNAKNKARWALVEAAKMTRLEPMADPDLMFPKRNEGALSELLSEAQKKAARLQPQIDRLVQTLEFGEADRAKLSSPRWEAGYDLALGRALACQVRTDNYNNTLAQMKGGKNFEHKESDTWVLVPADDNATSKLKSSAEKAIKLLKGVVENHEGTPWALIAKAELETPLGWKWTETHTGVNDPPPGDGNGEAPNPNDRINRIPRKPNRPGGVKL